MGFGGNEMRVGVTRRIMGSIHARNNPGRLRPDHAVRENTRAAMSLAQNAHAENPFALPYDTAPTGQRGEWFDHSPGGSQRGIDSMGKSRDRAADEYLRMKEARKSSSRLDPDRPSRRDVRDARRDYNELEKFSGVGSTGYGVKEIAREQPAPKGSRDSSKVNQTPYDNTPGPVMKQVLPAARAAGKAVGKVKASRAAKKASKGGSFDDIDGPY